MNLTIDEKNRKPQNSKALLIKQKRNKILSSDQSLHSLWLFGCLRLSLFFRTFRKSIWWVSVWNFFRDKVFLFGPIPLSKSWLVLRKSALKLNLLDFVLARQIQKARCLISWSFQVICRYFTIWRIIEWRPSLKVLNKQSLNKLSRMKQQQK